MLTNRELFVRDPLKTSIPNDGVAKVAEPQTTQEWDVLRYELQNFVCQGEYERGLERILSTYLRNLGEPVQPAVWVSGFYGSGKSHLVRVLEVLWRDVPFPDGATARGVVTLPAAIREQLQELTIAGRREGGLWSAAGTLGAGAGDNVRLALLGIVFRSAGLPGSYPQAQFVLWLVRNGYYDGVKAGVEAAGRGFESELRQMYVSPVLAGSLLACCPGFAPNEMAARALLKTQYPNAPDITDDEMVSAIADVLTLKSAAAGKCPCTLIVLDELQQFIDESSDRSLRVQNVVEACSARFGSRLLFVATGQSALQASTQLQKLQHRFTVQVALSDQDVEKVVREVVLRKLPDREAALRSVLDECSGEIDRQLVGTKIGPMDADRAVIAADYPLLPARRRFWERVLRAVDRAGAAGQLRTQLRLVHEAAREVAEEPVGCVVRADAIFDQQAPSMLQTGVLLQEVNEIIRRQDDGSADGKLRSRLCAAIFLIGQLPTDPGADTGLRATAETLADLLVQDLRDGSASLRERIPGLLADLAGKGSLLQLGDEYRLQTREGAEWEVEYRGRYARIFGDESRVASDRTRELKAACGKLLQGIALTQGKSKTPRKIEQHFAPEEPKSDTGAIPIWIRDEWSVAEKSVREDAQAGGADSPIVYVFLPRVSGDDLKKSLAGYEAATETLHAKGNPTTREGAEARLGMVTRQSEQRGQLDAHIASILKNARVFQGGGNEITGNDLCASVQAATEASLARLYPQFQAGDDPKWGLVAQRARQGSGEPLAALDYTGDTDKHPVCRQVLEFVGATGKKGSEVRKRFMGPGNGWPQDTVDGALLALVATNHLRASQNGTAVSVKQIDQSKLGQTEFHAEEVIITPIQRLEVRKLLTAAGFPYKQGEEGLALQGYLDLMIRLARGAGGERPLPAAPDTSHLEEMKSLNGNRLMARVYEERDRLTQEYATWKTAKEMAEARLPRWRKLERLLKHAEARPEQTEVAQQAEAIRTQRSLLADPDPVPPLCALLADRLRSAARAAREEHLDAYRAKIEELVESPEWARLGETDQQQIRATNGLGPLPPLEVGTEEELLAALDETPLPKWEEKTAALSERIARARLEAARRLEPQAIRVQLPSRTLRTSDEVDGFLSEARGLILEQIDAGHPVVV